MPFDPAAADRVRHALTRLELQVGEELSEKKMFGGVCFLLAGKMVLGVEKDRLMVRLTDDELQAALADGTAMPMDFTGRPMRNFAFVPPEGCQTEAQILEWASRSASFVRSHKPGSRSRSKAKPKV